MITLRVVAFAASLFLCVPHAWCQTNQKNLKLGALVSLTGAAAVHGEGIRKGVELAKKELEAEGWRIDLAVEDDGTTPARTVSALRHLIARDYRFIVGPTWSFLVESTVPILAKEKVLVISPANSSDTAGASAPNLFFAVPKVDAKVDVVTEWLKREKFSRAAIIYAESRWGDLHEAAYRKAAEAAGVIIIATESFNYGDEKSAIAPLLDRIRSLKPDLILTTSSREGDAELTRHAVLRKFRGAILSTEDMLDAEREHLLPAALNEVRLFALRWAMTPAFEHKFREAYGTSALQYSENAYDAVRLLAHGVEATDGSPQAVQEYFRTMAPYRGAAGSWSFDEKGDVSRGSCGIVRVR